MKNLLNLKGAEQLSKQEQSSINGGMGNGCLSYKKRCQNHCCPTGYCCGADPFNCVLAEDDLSNCR